MSTKADPTRLWVGRYTGTRSRMSAPRHPFGPGEPPHRRNLRRGILPTADDDHHPLAAPAASY